MSEVPSAAQPREMAGVAKLLLGTIALLSMVIAGLSAAIRDYITTVCWLLVGSGEMIRLTLGTLRVHREWLTVITVVMLALNAMLAIKLSFTGGIIHEIIIHLLIALVSSLWLIEMRYFSVKSRD